MFKKSILALAATASIVAAAAPVAVEARTHHRHYTSSHVYRGTNGRYRCHRGNGTQGTIIGAGAGALAGAAVTHGAAGPIIGAVGGGLLGRHIGRHTVHCR
ncbi:MAG: glycine zipper 2TM domain-containing protein [Croceibacterium sp.]